ncbi:glycerol-3-phosphate responsive antiterminator [Clostridium sp. CX1]|uniref:Glycerol-3-phosphate responsive antiterminator n=1 Tax=Clostridium tanneri TaxID=3037988 RepID=A0ABU4JNQ2_9CLOT|nr:MULTISPECIES: glycerol-3-phosphate responsive antiterminator [unclassified Clostridium]MCT8976173.1 glycerol-3-phosphate responsive antiterminator [Clostridium sp. CX1]MDW8799737.1 glycerol-3-phosphate responsive antiterminator [Clostridium sp. A1-XYC3]
MNMLREMLMENPIIAAIRDNKELEKVFKSKASIVFVLYGDILTIPKICQRLKENKKTVFIHVDLIEGLRGDSAGIKYVKEYVKPDGIISTKTSNIKYGNALGMYTIQRIFVIDSLSLKTGIKNILDIKPNAVEVMPGVASKIISFLNKEVRTDIIAGGLIKNKKDVMDSLAAGAIAISTTEQELWEL